ncbi:MAG TPA: helix-turn-helix transcriptional regulator [Rhodanobacter sp.]|nr:helix-turn-helix transcriptional regulator [Rhodanobacter sp.]
MSDASPLTRYQLAELGALLAEPARAAILLALMDGTMRPAGELARIAGVSAATASAHLKRLLDGGLLGLHEQGRYRYFRLASDDVAAWLEALALPHASRKAPHPVVGDPALRRARTCYRHLAGQLGVALCNAWLERGWLQAGSQGIQLLPVAGEALAEAGWQTAIVQNLLRLHGRSCLDWTERRLHLGGPLGVALTHAMIDAGWLRRARRHRALLPSPIGLRRLAELGVPVDAPEE